MVLVTMASAATKKSPLMASPPARSSRAMFARAFPPLLAVFDILDSRQAPQRPCDALQALPALRIGLQADLECIGQRVFDEVLEQGGLMCHPCP
jgi:hypothetical protein